MTWRISHRADAKAAVIADRHYSRQRPGTPQFVPPGRCFVLVTDGAYWVTSWPYPEYVKHLWGGAWICTAFRNESVALSSTLILDAVAATRWFWSAYGAEPPYLGMVTFVDTKKVRTKRDPGRCFIKAGFVPVGWTEGGLRVLQLFPRQMPPAYAPIGGQLLLCEVVA